MPCPCPEYAGGTAGQSWLVRLKLCVGSTSVSGAACGSFSQKQYALASTLRHIGTSCWLSCAGRQLVICSRMCQYWPSLQTGCCIQSTQHLPAVQAGLDTCTASLHAQQTVHPVVHRCTPLTLSCICSRGGVPEASVWCEAGPASAAVVADEEVCLIRLQHGHSTCDSMKGERRMRTAAGS